MRNFGLLVLALVASSFGVACGGNTDGAQASGGAAGGGGQAASGGQGATGGSAGNGGSSNMVGVVQTLVDANWTLPPGEETYLCARQTTTMELWVHEYRPVIPKGTHHTVVTLEDGSKPDGVTPCDNPFEGSAQNMIYGTGAGSVTAVFPAGVATHIPKGTQVLVNLHLFNVDADPLTGRSAIEVLSIDPADVEHESTSTLLGLAMGLTVPPGVSTQNKTCVVPSDLNAFIVQPHMHQMGTHFSAVVRPKDGSAPITLLDTPYEFDAQVHRSIDPSVVLSPGDEIDIGCSYENPTQKTVGFGESTKDEMCFMGIHYWPTVPLFCF